MDLLTGCTGYLGSHLAAKLAADGRDVRALVRVGADLKRIPPTVREVVWGSLDDPSAIARATHGIDTVFHTAARVSGGGQRARFERDNIQACEDLLEAADAAGVRRFVHVSSAGIFGAEASKGQISDDTPLDPQIEKRGLYAWSKAASDELVRRFAQSSRVEIVVVRPAILYGGEAKPFLGRLSFPIPRVKNKRLVVGTPETLLPLTHVDNACDAIVLAARQGRPGAAYNVVDGDVTLGEYLALLARSGVSRVEPRYLRPFWISPLALGCDVASRLTGRSLPLSRYKLRRATENLRYDTSAAQRDLGWQPRVSLEAGIAGMRAASSASPEAADARN